MASNAHDVIDYMAEMETLSKAEAEQRLRDWEKRLEALYGQIEKWRKKHAPDWVPVRGWTPQVREEPMKRHNIRPGKLPTYSLMHGDKQISFVPSSLWVIGANGNVGIITNENAYSLYDMEHARGKARRWMAASKDPRKGLVPFDEDFFVTLLNE